MGNFTDELRWATTTLPKCLRGLLSPHAWVEGSKKLSEGGDYGSADLLKEVSPPKVADRPMLNRSLCIEQCIWIDRARFTDRLKERNIVVAI